jgi:hypothetical protein
MIIQYLTAEVRDMTEYQGMLGDESSPQFSVPGGFWGTSPHKDGLLPRYGEQHHFRRFTINYSD